MNHEMLLGVVRHVLTLAAGYMASKGHMRGEYVEMFVNSMIGLGVVGWSMASKTQATTSVAPPAAEPRAATPSVSPSTKALIFLLALLTGLAALHATAALADNPPAKQGKIWSGQQLPEALLPPATSGAFYFSVFGSHLSVDGDFDDGLFRAGLGVGYLAKYNALGVGVDFDASRQLDEEKVKFDDELDNWNFSARARVGYFVTPTLMPYASVGYARLFTVDTMSYGLGVESFVSERVSVRFEATKYEVSDDLLDLKLGVSFKF